MNDNKKIKKILADSYIWAEGYSHFTAGGDREVKIEANCDEANAILILKQADQIRIFGNLNGKKLSSDPFMFALRESQVRAWEIAWIVDNAFQSATNFKVPDNVTPGTAVRFLGSTCDGNLILIAATVRPNGAVIERFEWRMRNFAQAQSTIARYFAHVGVTFNMLNERLEKEDVLNG